MALWGFLAATLALAAWSWTSGVFLTTAHAQGNVMSTSRCRMIHITGEVTEPGKSWHIPKCTSSDTKKKTGSRISSTRTGGTRREVQQPVYCRTRSRPRSALVQVSQRPLFAPSPQGQWTSNPLAFESPVHMRGPADTSTLTTSHGLAGPE